MPRNRYLVYIDVKAGKAKVATLEQGAKDEDGILGGNPLKVHLKTTLFHRTAHLLADGVNTSFKFTYRIDELGNHELKLIERGTGAEVVLKR